MAKSEDISLPEELGVEGESPYLRRTQVVAIPRRRRRRRIWWALGITSILAVTGYAGSVLATFALSSPLFRLTSAEVVLVEGNGYVSREEVLSALGFSPMEMARTSLNLFRLSLAEKRRQVEAVPWVQSATLTRAFPHRLGVQIIERTPVAFVNAEGRLKLVDREGFLLEKPERAVFDFPVLTGLDGVVNLAERKTRLNLYEDFQKQVGPEAARAGWLVSEADLSDTDDLKALLVRRNETVQVHFGHSDFLERFHNFLTLRPELQKTVRKVDSVDLRYQHQIVVNPQPVGHGSPDGQSGPTGLADKR